MTRPIIGIIGNSYELDDRYPIHAGGTMNSEALAAVAGCMPLIVPSIPDTFRCRNCWRRAMVSF